MRKASWPLPILVGCLWGCALLGKPDEPRRVERDELTDFSALRESYGAREDFVELCERDRPLRRTYDALRRRDYERVLALSTPWLEACPVDIDFHIFRGHALVGLGRLPDAKPHFAWRKGLVQSVLSSGDGNTPETAWRVISVGEEYAILRVLGLRLERQSLHEGRIDRMDVVDQDGQPRTVYFDPAPHFERLERMLREAEGAGPAS